MTSIVCPVIHAGIFPQHNPQIVLTKPVCFQITLLFDILWWVSAVQYLYRWKPHIVLRLPFTYIWSTLSFSLHLSTGSKLWENKQMETHNCWAIGSPSLFSSLPVPPLPLLLRTGDEFRGEKFHHVPEDLLSISQQ